jgi:hypothetical protein
MPMIRRLPTVRALAALALLPTAWAAPMAGAPSTALAAPAAVAQPACRVKVAEVIDLRADKQSLGFVGGRSIQSPDAAGWIRDGMGGLAKEGRLVLVAGDEGSDLEVQVEVLKAYIYTITQVKAATVVVRVRYRHGGAEIDQMVYRGTKDALNWWNGDKEARGALDLALAEAVGMIQMDTLATCSRVAKAPAVAG